MPHKSGGCKSNCPCKMKPKTKPKPKPKTKYGKKNK